MTVERDVALIRQMAHDKPEWTFYFVGGFPRDQIVGVHSKDVDVEVFGDYTRREFIEFFQRYGKVSGEVGKSFQALKLHTGHGMPIDVLQPRKDRKVGEGHKGFLTSADPRMTEVEAAFRRDFTCNALMIEVRSGKVFDFFGGIQDLQDKRLRIVSHHFAEDPLRVLRGMQQSARLDLTATDETVEVCRAIVDKYAELSIERVWDEFFKLFKARKPSRGLVFLSRTGWIQHFPALRDLRRLPQDAKHHPEGSAWVHTKMVADEAAEIARREKLSTEDTVVLVASAILHDVGKAVTTQVVDGRIVTRQHAEVGAEIAVAFLMEIGAPRYVIDGVQEMVREHMFIAGEFTHKSVRRLSGRLVKTSIRMLSFLMEADIRGRGRVTPQRIEQVQALTEIAEQLQVTDEAPERILTGHHLIEMGYKPSRRFGVVLSEVYGKQLDGEISTLAEAKRLVTAIF